MFTHPPAVRFQGVSSHPPSMVITWPTLSPVQKLNAPWWRPWPRHWPITDLLLLGFLTRITPLSFSSLQPLKCQSQEPSIPNNLGTFVLGDLLALHLPHHKRHPTLDLDSQVTMHNLRAVHGDDLTPLFASQRLHTRQAQELVPPASEQQLAGQVEQPRHLEQPPWQPPHEEHRVDIVPSSAHQASDETCRCSQRWDLLGAARLLQLGIQSSCHSPGRSARHRFQNPVSKRCDIPDRMRNKLRCSARGRAPDPERHRPRKPSCPRSRPSGSTCPPPSHQFQLL